MDRRYQKGSEETRKREGGREEVGKKDRDRSHALEGIRLGVQTQLQKHRWVSESTHAQPLTSRGSDSASMRVSVSVLAADHRWSARKRESSH